MNDKTLLTIDVSHGTTHDGPGMRTTVFVKGCSLRCRWCQNPESIGARNEPWWDERACIGCLSCQSACPAGALSFTEKGLSIDRSACRACLSCCEACPSEALSPEAQRYTMDALMREVLRDRAYYEQFGGGVTCSGGEPLLQYEFLAEFFERLHAENITAALDTCGCAPQNNLEALLPVTDYLLYDMKIFDPEQHRAFTGQDNALILSNLLRAADSMRHRGYPKKLWIRTPLIWDATATSENIRAIGRFISENLSDVLERWEDVLERWEMCAFNGACVTKYDKLGLRWDYAGRGTMSRTQIEPLRLAALENVSEDKLLVSGMIREK